MYIMYKNFSDTLKFNLITAMIKSLETDIHGIEVKSEDDKCKDPLLPKLNIYINGDLRATIDMKQLLDDYKGNLIYLKEYISDMTPAQKLKHHKYKKLVESKLENVIYEIKENRCVVFLIDTENNQIIETGYISKTADLDDAIDMVIKSFYHRGHTVKAKQ